MKKNLFQEMVVGEGGWSGIAYPTPPSPLSLSTGLFNKIRAIPLVLALLSGTVLWLLDLLKIQKKKLWNSYLVFINLFKINFE